MTNIELFAPQDASQSGPAEGCPPPDDDFRPIIPAPRAPSPEELAHWKYGQPAAVYPYWNATGEVVGYVCRYEFNENGKPEKAFFPVRYGRYKGREGYHKQGWKNDKSRPLFNLPSLMNAGNDTTLVVEGEKAALGASEHYPGLVAVTPMNGAQSPHLTDWSPLVGHPVIICPDNDAAGRAFARKVAPLLRKAGVTDIRIMKTPADYPESWDLGDPFPPNAEEAAARRLLDTAKAFHDPETDGPDMSILRRNVRPAPDFLIDVLGAWAPHVKALAEATSTPVDYSATALLVTAATLMGTSCMASPWEGWAEHLALWIAQIGDPSAGKSPAQAPFTKLLYDFEHEDEGAFNLEHQTWEAECAMAAEKREAWKRKTKISLKSGAESQPLPADACDPPEPVRPRLVVSDTTPEALAKVIAARGGPMAFRDELAGLLAFDRYSTGDGGGRSFWLEAFGGRPFTVDRVKNPSPIIIPHLLVSVLGGIQPDRISSLLLSGDDDGLSARFLYCWPDSLPRRRPTTLIDHATITEALRKLRNL